MYELIAIIAVTLVMHTWFVIAGKKLFKRTWYLIWRGITAPFRFTFNLVRNNRVAVLIALLVVGFGVFKYAEYDSRQRAVRLAAYMEYEEAVRKSDEEMVHENAKELSDLGHWEPRED